MIADSDAGQLLGLIQASIVSEPEMSNMADSGTVSAPLDEIFAAGSLPFRIVPVSPVTWRSSFCALASCTGLITPSVNSRQSRFDGSPKLYIRFAVGPPPLPVPPV